MLAYVVEMQDAVDGPDVRSQVQAVARVLVPDLAERVDEFLADYSPSKAAPEREIDALYEELRDLAVASEEDRYRDALTRLRALQDAEARRMAAYFDANRPLRPDEAEAAISRAEALIAEHENPTPPDAAARDAD